MCASYPILDRFHCIKESSRNTFFDWHRYVAFFFTSIYTPDGHEVKEITSIENSGTYVAVGYGQRLVKTSYNTKPELLTLKRLV